MAQTIWWYLTNQYHTEPYVGHANVRKSRDCYECRQIEALFQKVAQVKAGG